MQQQTNTRRAFKLFLASSRKAMELLQANNQLAAYAILIQSLKSLKENNEKFPESTLLQLKATTLNNLACYYRKVSKPAVALKCLLKVLSIEKSLHGTTDITLTTTLLNITAVYSSLNQHSVALEHSKAALKILQTIPPALRDTKYYANLAIAHYNIAAECEHLKKAGGSLIGNYTKSIKIANEKLGPENPLARSITRNYLNARKSLSQTQSCFNEKRKSCTNIMQKSFVKDESYWDQQMVKENKYNRYYLSFAKVMRKRKVSNKTVIINQNVPSISHNGDKCRKSWKRHNSVIGGKGRSTDESVIKGLVNNCNMHQSRSNGKLIKTFF